MSQAAYIVLLLSAVHAVDHLFQAQAKEICESVGGSVRAPPPKGFMRRGSGVSGLDVVLLSKRA